MSDEEREVAVRSQSVVLQGPADGRTMAAAMRPGVERCGELTNSAAPACLVITPTIEQALSAAEHARVMLGSEAMRVVPVSHVARAQRVLAAGTVALVTGTAGDLLALRRASALRLDGLRAVIMIGLDDVLAEGDGESLQSLLADVPSDAMRVATIDVSTDGVEAFAEAQLHRARRIAPPPVSDVALGVMPSYVVTSRVGRAEALRHVLDAVDPPSLVVVASTDVSVGDARNALTRLGLAVDGLLVQVVRQPTSQHVSMVVLWDAPSSAEALTDALATRPVEAIALLTPEELPAFRRLTNGAATAWTAPARKAGAASRIQRMRAAVRDALQHGGGATASELALLAPLMDAFDPVEIASATLRLYEAALRDMVVLKDSTTQAALRAEATVSRAARSAPSAPAGRMTVASGGAKQRVFLAVGKRDEVRVGDIVGAVANEAGIDGTRIGAVELSESHSTVELSAEDAARAVEALANATLRGRRLNARLDDRAGHDRGAARGESRGPRTFGPPRDGPRGERSDRPPARGRPTHIEGRGDGRGTAPRDARDARGAGRDGAHRDTRDPSRDRSRPSTPRSSFGTVGARRDFGDRPPHERTEGTSEWSQRGERMKHAKRTPRIPEPTERPERTD